MEHTWLAVLTGFSGVAVSLLSILLATLRSWKKEVRAYIERVCEENDKDHAELWKRFNYHKHIGIGNVVIPQK
jgi:hypothetical protein